MNGHCAHHHRHPSETKRDGAEGGGRGEGRRHYQSVMSLEAMHGVKLLRGYYDLNLYYDLKH